MEYWQLEEEGWYLYKMATFPPQHWARVWRPSLRLGGVRLPGLSLHRDPNTYNLALTHSPASSKNSLLFRSSNKYLLQLKKYFGQSGGCLWPRELLLHCPDRVPDLYMALNDRLCIILTNTVPRYRIINCHSFKKIQKLKWVTFKSDFWLCWYKHLCLSLLKSFSIQLMFILVNCLLGARLTETVKTLLTRSSEPGRGRGPAGWHTPLIVLRGESEKTSDEHRDQIYRIFPQPAVAVYQQVTHSKHVRNVGRDCTILREGVYLVFYTLRIFST